MSTHLDAELLQDLRLFALADRQAGIVGEPREVQPGELRSAKVRLRQPRAIPVYAIERADEHRRTTEVRVDERRLGEAARQELAGLQHQARKIREARIAFVEGRPSQRRLSRQRPGEGRAMEARAAQASFASPNVQLAKRASSKRQLRKRRTREIHTFDCRQVKRHCSNRLSADRDHPTQEVLRAGGKRPAPCDCCLQFFPIDRAICRRAAHLFTYRMTVTAENEACRTHRLSTSSSVP